MRLKGPELEKFLSSVEQSFGKGVIIPLKANYTRADIAVISSGNTYLDYILGNGGFPEGSVVEIYGDQSTGKTTLCLQVIADVQNRGGLAAFVDAEHSLHLPYAIQVGVQTKDLVYVQPDYGEQALTITDELIRSGLFSVVVIDSAAALVPKSELQGEIGEQNFSAQAALMATALRRLVPAIKKNKTVLIFTNQIRTDFSSSWRNAETTPAGRALKFYTTIRLELQKPYTDQREFSTADAEFTDINALVVKSKVSKPFQQALLSLQYGVGFNSMYALLDLAVLKGVIQSSGVNTYTYKQFTWYSKQDFQEQVTDDLSLVEQLQVEIRGSNT